MADDQDKSQKTEEPTQRRLDQAHDKGDVVKSTEVSTFVVLTAGALAISIFGRSTAQGFATHFSIFLQQPEQFTMEFNRFGSTVLSATISPATLFIYINRPELSGCEPL